MAYFRPSTPSSAVALLNGKARIIAGGTDLAVRIEKGVFKPEDIVDITYLPLRYVRENGDNIEIGALTNMSQIASDDLLWRTFPLLPKAASQIAAPPIRNRATIGGNIVNASPAADSVAALIALDAQVKLLSGSGERIVALTDFFTGPGKCVRRDDELLTEVIIKKTHKPDTRVISHFHKMGQRKAQVISIVAMACLTELDEAGRVLKSRIGIASVAPVPFRAYEVEKFLEGSVLNDETIEKAAKMVSEAIKPIDDVRGKASYRKHVAGAFLKRHLTDSEEGRAGIASFKTPYNEKAHAEFAPSGGICVTVNGEKYNYNGNMNVRLLDFLRDELLFTGAKNGCGEGECGACTVLLDGVPVNACMILTGGVDGREITTIEGIMEGSDPGNVQKSFVDAGAVQCGFCIPGFEMTAHHLVENVKNPSREQIREALSGNLCRCTGYEKIFEAVELASERKNTDEK
ncbi:FAD binding domain-containing protein [Myxococcota bacterium]|nr:FAD binding domain-containing protein [Myxococcota bacterium]MBU1380628.1 FAD binding domain-containing protein [Myxococcota bacterium]MBU1496971.1 FAD binding domain-containing protein [Myxococcota bacterium]